MKSFDELMTNGVVKCGTSQCRFNFAGKCCHFASTNEADVENDCCAGDCVEEVEPLNIGWFRFDFASFTDEELSTLSALLERLKVCCDVSSPRVVDVWKVLQRVRTLATVELGIRSDAVKEPVRKSLALTASTKKAIRPVRSRKSLT